MSLVSEISHHQDAMALCGVYGPPDLFVTFICNTKWREIADALRYKPGQLSCVRSDLIVPIFHMNVDEFVHDIRDCRTFGAVRAVEFQKNGLPHIQFLVRLADAHPEFSASMIEQLGDDSGSSNNGAGTLDQTRAHPAPNKRFAKWLSTEEQAGESEGDRGGSATAGAEDMLVMMVWMHSSPALLHEQRSSCPFCPLHVEPAQVHRHVIVIHSWLQHV